MIMIYNQFYANTFLLGLGQHVVKDEIECNLEREPFMPSQNIWITTFKRYVVNYLVIFETISQQLARCWNVKDSLTNQFNYTKPSLNLNTCGRHVTSS